MAKAPTDTRKRILETAERLFAEHGIDQTSIRLINQTAGQRNSSAAQYHFGSKSGLISAIFDYRMEAINEQRLQMLRLLPSDDARIGLRALAEVLVNPLADCLQHRDNGFYYIPVAAQVIGHPTYHTLAKKRRIHGTGLQRVTRMMQHRLPQLPDALFRQRFGMTLRQVFNELADYQRLNFLKSGSPRRDIRALVDTLIDAVTAQLAAPVSPTTQSEFEHAGRSSA